MFQKKYHINKRKAENALQNILAANDQEASDCSKDSLSVLHKKRSKRLFLTILVGIIIAAGLVFVIVLLLRSRNAVPTQPMSLISDRVEDQQLYLTINTGGHKISMQDSYLRTIDGAQYSPISYDKKEAVICFPYPDAECNIYITARDGTQLHLLLSPHAVTGP